MREHGATFLISVPNDAFWSIQNPHHRTSLGRGRLRGAARPAAGGAHAAAPGALSGSALVGWEAAPERHELEVEAGGARAVATHFIAAFGPRHAAAHGCARGQADMIEQRRWERQRESDSARAEATSARARWPLDAAAWSASSARSCAARRLVRGVAHLHPQARARAGRPLSGMSRGTPYRVGARLEDDRTPRRHGTRPRRRGERAPAPRAASGQRRTGTDPADAGDPR